MAPWRSADDGKALCVRPLLLLLRTLAGRDLGVRSKIRPPPACPFLCATRARRTPDRIGILARHSRPDAAGCARNLNLIRGAPGIAYGSKRASELSRLSGALPWPPFALRPRRRRVRCAGPESPGHPSTARPRTERRLPRGHFSAGPRTTFSRSLSWVFAARQPLDRLLSAVDRCFCPTLSQPWRGTCEPSLMDQAYPGFRRPRRGRAPQPVRVPALFPHERPGEAGLPRSPAHGTGRALRRRDCLESAVYYIRLRNAIPTAAAVRIVGLHRYPRLYLSTVSLLSPRQMSVRDRFVLSQSPRLVRQATWDEVVPYFYTFFTSSRLLKVEDGCSAWSRLEIWSPRPRPRR